MSKWQRHYDFFFEDGYSMMSDERFLEEVKAFFTAHQLVEDDFIDWCSKRYANQKMDDFDEDCLTSRNW